MTSTTAEMAEQQVQQEVNPEVESELEYESDEDQLPHQEDQEDSHEYNNPEGHSYDTNNEFSTDDNDRYTRPEDDLDKEEQENGKEDNDKFYHRDDEPNQILADEEEYIVEQYSNGDEWESEGEAGEEVGEEFNNQSDGEEYPVHELGEGDEEYEHHLDNTQEEDYENEEDHQEIEEELQNEFLSDEETNGDGEINNNSVNNDNHSIEGSSNDPLSEIPVYLDIGNDVVKLFPPNCYEEAMFSELPLLFNNTNIIDQPISEVFDTFKLFTSTLDDVIIFKIPTLSNLTIRSDSIECRTITVANILEIFDILKQQDEETYKFVQIEVSKEVGLRSHLKSIKEGAISPMIKANDDVESGSKRSITNIEQDQNGDHKRVKEV